MRGGSTSSWRRGGGHAGAATERRPLLQPCFALTAFLRRRPLTFALVAPALALQLGIMGWAHWHIEGGLANFTGTLLLRATAVREHAHLMRIVTSSGG